MELIVSIVVGVLLVEVYAWLPKISEWLLERAVGRLANGKEQYREQWKADLNALPNTVIKLAWALHLKMAADRINADVFQAKCDDLDCSFKHLRDTHSKNVQKLHALKAFFAEAQKTSKGKLDQTLEQFTASIETFETRLDLISADQPLQESVRQCAINALAFRDTVSLACTKSWELLGARIDRASTKIDQADNLVKLSFEKHLPIMERLAERGPPSKATMNALDDLSNDLDKLAVAVQGDDNDEIDIQLKSAHDRIASAIRTIVKRTQLP